MIEDTIENAPIVVPYGKYHLLERENKRLVDEMDELGRTVAQIKATCDGHPLDFENCVTFSVRINKGLTAEQTLRILNEELLRMLRKELEVE